MNNLPNRKVEPSPSTPEAQQVLTDVRLWAKNQGIDTTAEGLIVPDRDTDKLDRKIAKDLVDVAGRIKQAKDSGLDVLYLPGSYDMVHAGHLSYVEQVVNDYLEEAHKRGRNVTRENLYLVMLADDDQLIAHTKASKYVGNGGTEAFRRPVEKGLDSKGRSPRLDALASFPVDCVGFIPSPTTKNLPKPYPLNLEACRNIAVATAAPDKLPYFKGVIDAYQHIQESYDNGQGFDDLPLNIAAWQLYVTLQITRPDPTKLAEVPEPFTGKCITRAVSFRDESYLYAVEMIMRWSEVAVTVIHDQQIISTSDMLANNSPHELLAHKQAAQES